MLSEMKMSVKGEVEGHVLNSHEMTLIIMKNHGIVFLIFLEFTYHIFAIYKYSPEGKNGPASGSNVLHRLILGKWEKILSKTTRPRALIFRM